LYPLAVEGVLPQINLEGGILMLENHEGDHFLMIQEVAEKLHVCRASIYSWAKAGVFPQPLKFGSSSRWSALELEEWLRTRPKGAYGEYK
jgi:predicted DNA-binding transcriptional regulator AlpA